MGSDGSPDRTLRRGYSDRSINRIFTQHCCLSSVLPFIVGLLLVFSVFQLSSPSFRYGNSDPRRLLTVSTSSDPLRRACEACKCLPSASRAQHDLASKLAGTLTSQTAAAVLDAANSTDPALQTVRVNKDSLESLFLFIGVLSGRGYRHRRLAVREAWGNRAQVPGISAARFILSEDERTPQVGKFGFLIPPASPENLSWVGRDFSYHQQWTLADLFPGSSSRRPLSYFHLSWFLGLGAAVIWVQGTQAYDTLIAAPRVLSAAAEQQKSSRLLINWRFSSIRH